MKNNAISIQTRTRSTRMTNRTATTVARIRPIVARMVRTGTVARTGTSGIVSLTTQGDSHAFIT